ncbi:MAG: ATP-binding cassette domain-containing protein [Bacteroidales bacterium]|nr:ATP-binding cassette domain-containing protein [Bacteroidales bacterium]MBD5281517.1 ATP-binding cassette domain-containing protein [Bacteroides sp.]MBD5294387.1 ATP-binding cassette domain-containing protein [Bacteroides sp.]MBD5342278.1 ATP-binding cassette domain-containing protein [Bacteroides sp.]MBD5363477.1 ATP-binding cassette domain-containing protein [Bacteroides sp.]
MEDLIIDYSDAEVLRKELVVLKHVNFRLSKGEFVYFIGKVGSGKSSLLKTMYAEVPVNSGEARAFEFDLLKLKAKRVHLLRRKIGIVFQDFQLLTDRSVHENLLFVLKATGWKDKQLMEERIEKVLGMVNMANKSYKMPHELSGGEQQRIAIARALLNEPDLILADEPTGNLDPETGTRIVEMLHQIAADNKTAVIMATHNLALTEQFPAKIYRIEDKRLICLSENPQEIKTQEDIEE